MTLQGGIIYFPADICSLTQSYYNVLESHGTLEVTVKCEEIIEEGTKIGKYKVDAVWQMKVMLQCKVSCFYGP